MSSEALMKVGQHLLQQTADGACIYHYTCTRCRRRLPMPVEFENWRCDPWPLGVPMRTGWGYEYLQGGAL